MPLKPIFEKAPLKNVVRLPLRPGQLIVEDETLSILRRLGEEQNTADLPMLWEGLFRVCALLEPHAERLPVAALITDALSRQQEDGSLPYPLADSLAVVRAAWALYEATAKRELLEKVLLWCGSLAADLSSVIACDAVRREPADLMDLLEQVYRVTGRKGLPVMMERLRHDGMNWAGVLHTFSVQQPLSRITPVKDLLQGIRDEGSEEGFYTRQTLTCHGTSLADGARSAVMSGAYSGNGQELSAARIGWERISRYHGAVCGGLQCDELLAGAAPSAGVDSQALGAWMEALCAAMEQDEDSVLWDDLALIRANALPKAVWGGSLKLLQHVNSVKAGSDAKPVTPFSSGNDLYIPALSRLLRGVAAMYCHAVTLSPDAVLVAMPLNGKCSCMMDGKSFSMNLSSTKEGMKITVHTKEPVSFRIRLRIPGYTENGFIKVSRGGSARAAAGEIREATRAWQDQDTVTCTWQNTLRSSQGFHQGLCFYAGDTLLTLPADAGTDWSVAVCGNVTLGEGGSYLLPVASVKDWKLVKGQPSGLPVLPETVDDVRTVRLASYADTYGISLFPQGSKH